MNKMPLGSKGLGIGRKRYRLLHKKMPGKGKHDVTKSVNTCSCLEPAFIAILLYNYDDFNFVISLPREN